MEVRNRRRGLSLPHTQGGQKEKSTNKIKMSACVPAPFFLSAACRGHKFEPGAKRGFPPPPISAAEDRRRQKRGGREKTRAGRTASTSSSSSSSYAVFPPDAHNGASSIKSDSRAAEGKKVFFLARRDACAAQTRKTSCAPYALRMMFVGWLQRAWRRRAESWFAGRAFYDLPSGECAPALRKKKLIQTLSHNFLARRIAR